MKRFRYAVVAVSLVATVAGTVAHGQTAPTTLQELLKELSATQAKLVSLQNALVTSADTSRDALVPVKRGDRGEGVIALQTYLIRTRDLAIPEPTGYFGAMTETAVRKFQTREGVPALGIVGPLTIAAIRQRFIKEMPVEPQAISTPFTEPSTSVIEPSAQAEPVAQTPELLPVIEAAPPQYEPIGHWRFDGSGLNQVTGGAVAEKFGSVSFQPSGGRFGGYAYIQGNKDSEKGAVKILHQNTFNLPTAFSIEFWFRQRNEQNATQELVYKGPGPNYNFRIFREAGKGGNPGALVAGYTEADSKEWKEARAADEFKSGIWRHVVMTKNAAEVVLYVNGVRVGTNKTANGNAFTTAGDIVIGESMADGDFDNLRIYGYALSDANVLYNYQATSAVVELPTPEQQLASIAAALSDIVSKASALLAK